MPKKRIRMSVILSVLMLMLSACGGGGGKAPAEDQAKAPASNNEPPAAASAAQYGDTGGLKLPLVDEPTTIKFMLPSNSSKIGDDKLIVQELLKRTGIKVEFQTYSPQTYQDKLKVVVASGKLPDIFIGLK